MCTLLARVLYINKHRLKPCVLCNYLLEEKIADISSQTIHYVKMSSLLMRKNYIGGPNPKKLLRKKVTEFGR